MAHEIFAAAIQGGCTVCAAGLAVIGGVAALRNFRAEIPGRRRIELAEQTLVAFANFDDAMGFLKIDCGQIVFRGTRMPVRDFKLYDERRGRQDVSVTLDRFEAACRLSNLYHSNDLERILRKARRAYFILSGVYHDLLELGRSVQKEAEDPLKLTPEREKDLQAQFKSLSEPIDIMLGFKQPDNYFTLMKECGDELNAELKPHLSR